MGQLVAHRGYRARYPENTLMALEAALTAGRCHVEFDVQLSGDETPVLLHDPDLQRTTGTAGSVFHSRWSDLQALTANEPARFGIDHLAATIPSLQEALLLVQQYPERKAFVEIKEESLDHFGIHRTTELLLNAVEDFQEQCVIISYSAAALEEVQECSRLPVGWVIAEYDYPHREAANRLMPNYLICNHRRLPKQQSLWEGPWNWMAYEVNEISLAAELVEQGIEFIETAQVDALITEPLFRS